MDFIKRQISSKLKRQSQMATKSEEILPPLPPKSIRFMQEDDETFLSIGKYEVDVLLRAGLKDGYRLLDVGSGYGRLAYALIDRTVKVHYTGIDILPKHVTWCQDEISSGHPDFVFKHVDIRNDRYNPRGALDAKTDRFISENETFNLSCLFSVFTHMYEEEIENYLRTIWDALGDEGVCVATFFLFNENRMPHIVTGGSGTDLPMSHRLNEHTIYHNEADPLHAICYEQNFIWRLAEKIGFEASIIEYGTWAGLEKGGGYQDVVSLVKAKA